MGTMTVMVRNGGDGGFFLVCEEFGRMFDISFPACTFFFLKWSLGCAHYFHSLGPDQSILAQRSETSVAECSLTVRNKARTKDFI